ncbi:MAG: AAA family ATPase [Tepidisphaerales bacterium]
MAKEKSSKAASIELMLIDPAFPLEHRLSMLAQLCVDPTPDCRAVLTSLLEAAAAGKGKELYDKKIKDLDKLIGELKDGPLRMAAYVGASVGKRAHVILDEGAAAFPMVIDETLGASLSRGDSVLVDAGVKMIVDAVKDQPLTGEEAMFLRRVDGKYVEISLHDREKHVFLASADLTAKLEAGEVQPESWLRVCARRRMAFDVIPAQDTLNHFRYLDRSPVPEISIEQDIGDPHPFLDELSTHVRGEMTDPVIRRLYGIRRSASRMLVGTTGSGKTLSIDGFIRRSAEIVSEITNVPVEDLPPRLLRINMEKILSMWLGESDKALARVFDEAIELYDQPFVTPDGRAFYPPVIVVGEEIDALGRARGGDHESVHDRIMTVALKRLDINRPEYHDRLIIFLFSSNVPQLVDPAMLRRMGGEIVRFGRLSTPRAFRAVLTKLIRKLPCAGDEADPAAARHRVVNEVVDWLFGSDAEEGMVELDVASASQPLVKHRRDFITGALVDRAIQQAAAQACREHELGSDRPGLTTEMICEALDNQVRGIVDQLSEHNVGSYVDLPEGARVTRVRRGARPTAVFYQPLRS